MRCCCSAPYGAAERLRLASTSQLLAPARAAAFLSLAGRKEILFLLVFRGGKGHSPAALSVVVPVSRLREGELRRWSAGLLRQSILRPPPSLQPDSLPPPDFSPFPSGIFCAASRSPPRFPLPRAPSLSLSTSPCHLSFSAPTSLPCPRDEERGWQPALPNPAATDSLGT